MAPETGYIRLLKGLSEILDPRSDLGKRHLLCEVLFIVLVGLIAGANDAEGAVRFCANNLSWFRKFIKLKHGVPAHDTVLRVLALIKPAVIEEVARQWVNDFRAAHGCPPLVTAEEATETATDRPREHLAVDGKTLRGSHDKASGKRALHSVSVYLTELGVTLGQQMVDAKPNQITAIPDLLAALNIADTVVTIDAMGCQREIAATVIKGEADYMLHVKENQPTLAANCKAAFAEVSRPRLPGEPKVVLDRHREVDKGHGRIETRTCTVMPAANWVEQARDWPGLSKLVAIARERNVIADGKVSKTVDYYIVSETRGPLSAAQIAALAREHWRIENKCHHVLDVTYREDAHRLRDRNAAESMGILRRLSLGLCRAAVGDGLNIKGVREICGWNPENLTKVLCGEKLSLRIGARRRKLDPKRPQITPAKGNRKTTPPTTAKS